MEASYDQPALPFGIKIDPSKYLHQYPSQPVYRRFRMSNNFMLNNCQHLLVTGILALAQLIAYILYRRTRLRDGEAIAIQSKARKAMVFFLNRLHSAFESSFLVISISILLQLESINFETSPNGIAFIVLAGFLVVAIWEFH